MIVLRSLKVRLPVQFGVQTEPCSPAGSDNQFFKVVITRTGRARTFVESLTLHLCINSNLSPKWASEYTSDPTLQSLHRPNQILRATSADFKMPASQSFSRCTSITQDYMKRIVPMPNATSDEIAAEEIVATTSIPVQFLIDAHPRHATDFETYYHILSSALFLSLEVPFTQDEQPNPADLLERRAIRRGTPKVEADEEAWVPWNDIPEVRHWRGARTYTGNVSVSVYPAPEARLQRATGRLGGAEVVSQEQVVVASTEDCSDSECTLHTPVHYLSDDARAPTFVDGSLTSVRALLAKTPAERDLLAPLLEPVVSFPPEGEERVHRYYRVPEGHRPLIYVGETWVKKVTHRDEHKVTAPRPDAMPNALGKLLEAMNHMSDEL
jgi:hypothetical protein